MEHRPSTIAHVARFLCCEARGSLQDVDVHAIRTGQPVAGWLYHGSNEDELHELKPSAPSYSGGLGPGLYLAEKRTAAYYGRHVYRVRVALRNPFVLNWELLDDFPWVQHRTTLNQELIKRDPHQRFARRWQTPDDIDGDRLVKDLESHMQRSGLLAVHKRLQAGGRLTYEEQEAWDEAYDGWPPNMDPELPESVLVGEGVAPFVWQPTPGDLRVVVDRYDMEDIAPTVESLGHDALVARGLRFGQSTVADDHEVLVFKALSAKLVDSS